MEVQFGVTELLISRYWNRTGARIIAPHRASYPALLFAHCAPIAGGPLHLQMVVILQPASRRPFSMLPVTIFTTVMMNNCQQDAKSSYFLPF